MVSEMRSVYVHCPFCEVKCHYCDFYSLPFSSSAAVNAEDSRSPVEVFIQALRREIHQWKTAFQPTLDTLYLGGGTPSLLSADQWAQALDPLWERTRLTPETEWTIEANPASVTRTELQSYRALGMNRISLGIQALQPHLLKLLGRIHSPEGALDALEMIFAAGFEKVSVDLLCGIPGQTQEDLQNSLRRVLQFPITHLSVYLLTLSPTHRMWKQLPSEEIQEAQLLWLHQEMIRHRFEQYEISNFSKPGKESQHNLSYWKGRSYLGLGPSAHSYSAIHGRRWKNHASLQTYSRHLEQELSAIEWQENLSPSQLNLEKWMLALRLSEGFPIAWLETSRQQQKARGFENQKLLETHPHHVHRKRLTARGLLISDTLVSAFVD